MVPTTHMHLHSALVTLKKKVGSDQVLQALEAAPRVRVVDAKSGFKSTAAVLDFARESGHPRGDTYEAIVFRESVTCRGDEAYWFHAVHQEAIVVPENIDAIRALNGGYSRQQSMEMTDSALGIGR